MIISVDFSLLHTVWCAIIDQDEELAGDLVCDVTERLSVLALTTFPWKELAAARAGEWFIPCGWAQVRIRREQRWRWRWGQRQQRRDDGGAGLSWKTLELLFLRADHLFFLPFPVLHKPGETSEVQPLDFFFSFFLSKASEWVYPTASREALL